MNQQNDEARTYGKHIVQMSPEHSFCAGCASCEIVCSITHDSLVSSNDNNRIFVGRDEQLMMHIIHTCQNCSDHPCYEKCPRKDNAMCIDENGIVYVNEEGCIGCGMCVKACVFDPPRINMVKSDDKEKHKAKKCDMCRNRPDGPACVEWCPVQCLQISGDGVNT